MVAQRTAGKGHGPALRSTEANGRCGYESGCWGTTRRAGGLPRKIGEPSHLPGRLAPPRKSSRRQPVECLSLLRWTYDHHRDLRTRLPAAVVAYPIDRARQLMTITPFRHPHYRSRPTPRSHQRRPRSADSDRQHRLRQNQEHRIPDHWADRIRCGQNQRRAGHPTVVLSERQIRSSRGGKFPIDRHQRRCELPPRFPPSRLFGTPASVRPLTPVTGRRPKTLNESGHCCG